jgi:hypothetical protein
LTIRQLVAHVIFDKIVTLEAIHAVTRIFCQERPFFGATYLHSWDVSRNQRPPNLDPLNAITLSDSEVRTLSLQHPRIETRDWFGFDANGNMILRSAVVNSVDEISGRPPPSPEGSPTSSPPPLSQPELPRQSDHP